MTDFQGYTKCCINFNGASLCRVNSPIRKYSGSGSFYFDGDELLKKSENKAVNTLEITETSKKQPELFPFESQIKLKKPREYKLNKKTISRKIFAFFHSKLANKRFYFYTISFPLNTSDSAAFKLFNTVLTRLRKGYFVSETANYMLDFYSNTKSEKWRHAVNQLVKSNSFHQLNHYLWVAERQANGTIHFHIITSDILNVLIFNHFVASFIFNSLKKHDNNVKINHLEQSGYNGVDISKRRGGLSCVKDIKKYLTKYVTKNNTKFSNYAWHCSRSVSALFTTLEFPVSSLSSDKFPIDPNYKSEYYYICDYYTFIFYPNIQYEHVFNSLISVNNDIIDCFFSQ